MSSYEHDVIVPFEDSKQGKKAQVEEMFDKIAFRYDFLNRFLSAGIDKIWRRIAISQLRALQPKRVLDMATGTGDMAILAYKKLKPEHITGIDLSEGMLELGRQKVAKLGLNKQISLEKGDSETIKYPENSFDAITVAFGVRNYENLEQGLNEMYRVLKPKGKLVVLEFSQPSLPVVKQLFSFYMNVVTPAFGRLFAKNKKAYTYLNESVQKFPEGQRFVEILNDRGFKNTTLKKLSLGICSIYCGEK